ncbi:MAG: IPT/TIG domain-containing protein, partial [Acidobacteriota bacterium]
MIRHLSIGLVVLSLGVLAGCGGGGSTGPSSTAPRVTAVSPATGTTVGGTSVTITGSNFASGAVVTIGGVGATQITVINANTLTAMTGAHAAGAVDVVVAVGSQRGTLPGGYTYVAPQQSANAPPVISSLSAKGTKPQEPAQFADVGETINVSAAVTDAETPVPQLTFAWTATVSGSEPVGSFSGSGTNVTWTAPAAFSGTPTTVKVTLKITERYQTTDDVGLPITRENVVEKSTDLRLHNSAKEVSDLASAFLLAFSQQKPVDEIMKDFTTSCSDAASERADV